MSKAEGIACANAREEARVPMLTRGCKQLSALYVVKEFLMRAKPYYLRGKSRQSQSGQ